MHRSFSSRSCLRRVSIVFGIAALSVAGFAKELVYPHEYDPDPERLREEIDRFAAEDAESMPPKGAVVGLGSSSMRMWGPRMSKDLEGISVVPRGFGGSHFSDAIYFLDELALKYHPRAVIVYEGDNDSAVGKSPERIRDDLDFLVTKARQALPSLRFYVIGVKPSIRRISIWQQVVETNRLLAEYCSVHEGVEYIDVATPMLGPDGSPRADIFLKDELHLNELGYDLWAQAIAPIVIAGEAGREGESIEAE